MRAIKEIGCELSPVTFNWLMTLFVDSVPAEVCFKKLLLLRASVVAALPGRKLKCSNFPRRKKEEEEKKRKEGKRRERNEGMEKGKDLNEGKGREGKEGKERREK